MKKYKINYGLYHSNGSLVSENNGDGFSFEIGDGQLDPCLESCVSECEIGIPRTFLLDQYSAFGVVDDEAFASIEIDDFPEGCSVDIGMAVEFDTPAGDVYVGVIEGVEDGVVLVNFNHALAGQDIRFDVTIIEAC